MNSIGEKAGKGGKGGKKGQKSIMFDVGVSFWQQMMVENPVK